MDSLAIKPGLDSLVGMFQGEENVGGSERLVSSLVGTTLLVGAGRSDSALRLPVALLGGALLMRGLTGHCGLYRQLGLSSTEGRHHAAGSGLLTSPIKVQRTVTINATPQKLYSFWRRFENLPRFMDHLISVKEDENGRSHWVARSPGGGSVAWDAEIVEDEPDHKITWQSLPESDVCHNGSVTFNLAPGDRGTEVRVVLRYEAPAGKVGQLVAKLLGEEPGQQVQADLRRFKQVIEAGELARTDGQPVGARRNNR